MSKVFIEEETLIGIGNAIREKNGTTDLIATTDMATAISNLPTGSGATYPDLWYNGTTGTGTKTYYTTFDISQSSKLYFDYNAKKTGSVNVSNALWTIEVCKGYGVGDGSNSYSLTCELKELEDNAIIERVISQASNTTGSVEIDINDWDTLTLQISVRAGTNPQSSTTGYGYLHLSGIRLE